MPPSDLVDPLIVETSSGADEVALIGASQWGSVYRSVRAPFFYRVLQFDEAGLDRIHKARGWIQQPVRPGVASIVEVDQSVGGEFSFYFIKYRPDGRDTLTEALRDRDPATRLAAGAKICEALPTWWLNLGSPVLPTPADIVFSESGDAVILPSPFRSPPHGESVHARPERARYLSAERIRGTGNISGDGEDVFALGGILLECFYNPVELDAAEALTRAASRSLHVREALETRVPTWMERVETVQEARQAAWGLVQRKIDESAPVDLRDLAARLRHCARRLQPLELVKDLHSKGSLAEALDVVNEILRDDDARRDGCDVMVEAAGIATQLGRAIESLEWLERAISARPTQETAYMRQLEQIGRLEQSGAMKLSDAVGTDASAKFDPSQAEAMSRKLEALVWRDFEHLSQGISVDERMYFEGIVNRYLLNRSRWAEVRTFIEPKLWDGQTFLFWRFRHRLDDVEALLGLGAKEAAQRQLDDIEQGLRHVERNRSVSPSVIDASRRRLHELRVRSVQSGQGSVR